MSFSPCRSSLNPLPGVLTFQFWAATLAPFLVHHGIHRVPLAVYHANLAPWLDSATCSCQPLRCSFLAELMP